MVFLVFTDATTNVQPLKDRILARFPDDHYEVSAGTWLVSHSGTAKELYIRLFPEADFPLPSRNTIITGVAGYWGMAPQDLWEWIASKSGAKVG
jgi:hypothetical protein